MDRQGTDAVGLGRGGRADVQDDAAYEALANVVAKVLEVADGVAVPARGPVTGERGLARLAKPSPNPGPEAEIDVDHPASPVRVVDDQVDLRPAEVR